MWYEFDKAQTVFEMLHPSEENEFERTEFENNYYTYSAHASLLINNLSSQDLSSSQNNGVGLNQESRIARLEAELMSRDSNIDSMRDLLTRSPMSEQSAMRSHFPLPKLDLPTFSGNYDEWLGFRDSFEAIIGGDRTIPNIQKLHFLRSYLKRNALKIIDNLETIDTNYNISWDLLKNRFNNPRIIVQNHMSSLFDLPIIMKESASSLRNMLDSALRHVRSTWSYFQF